MLRFRFWLIAVQLKVPAKRISHGSRGVMRMLADHWFVRHHLHLSSRPELRGNLARSRNL